MAFDQTTRNRLARFVGDARRVLTEEFTRQCRQDFGIDPDSGEVSDLARLTHLNDSQRATARILRDTIDHYVVGSPSGGKPVAIERIIREQAFTVLNRLCAIRMAEAREILIESVGKGYQSKGFQLYARVAGSALGEIGDAYRCFLFSVFDEIATDFPSLFDRFSRQGRLFPGENALLKTLEEINHPDIDPLWSEDETIGWLYQYFNSVEERRQMRDESAAPRNSRELAVRNQFFTPRYVVEFLVDNTLGRIWYEMTQGQTGLKESCRYLVRRPASFLAPGEQMPKQDETATNLSQEALLKQPVQIPHRPLKDPREIRLLDPACGSMHFGLYAFDLFTVIYDEAWEIALGTDETAKSTETFAPFVTFAATFSDKSTFIREVPRLIVEHNIHGVDIDSRAVQIAGLSLWLRAQRAWHDAGVKPLDRPRITRSNIVCAEPMPGETRLLGEFIPRQFPAGEQGVFGYLLEKIFNCMKLAGEAGSLLRIEEEIRDAIAEAKSLWQQVPQHEQILLFAAPTASPAPRQLRLDLTGITDEQFWERAEQRIYEALETYASQAESGRGFQRRLFADDAAQGFAFIDLCRKRYDVAVMNPPFGLGPIRNFPWLKQQYPDAYVDLFAAFVSRMTEKCQFLGAITSRSVLLSKKLLRIRENTFAKKMIALVDLGLGVMDAALVESCAYVIGLERTPLCIVIDLVAESDKQAALEHTVLTNAFSIFDLSIPALLPRFMIVPGLDRKTVESLFGRNTFFPMAGKARHGLNTFDNFRFLRLRWEVAVEPRLKTWEPLAKGGVAAQVYADLPLLVKWNNDGKELAEVNRLVNGQTAQSRQASNYYRLPGLTYSRRSSKAFTVRVLPAGCIIGEKGPAILPVEADILPFLLGWFQSNLVRTLVEMQANAKQYDSGIVDRLPWMQPPKEMKNEVGEISLRLLDMFRENASYSEVDPHFCGIRVCSSIAELEKQSLDGQRHLFDQATSTFSEIDKKIDLLFGVDSKKLRELTVDDQEPIDDGDGDEDEGNDVAPSNAPGLVLSYAIGLAVGRFDVRTAIFPPNPRIKNMPFGPIPICPPGILQGDDGLPLTPEAGRQLRAEGRYPLDVTWDGILVDDSQHPLDVETRVRAALAVIWGERTDAIEHEACSLLGVRTLREWIRKPAGFFADHLKRYSKSRRQAPIYWPVSTATGSYTLWIYYHRLTDQTLFTAVNDFIEPRLTQVSGEASRLRGKTNRSAADETVLEESASLEIELREFRDELLRIARFWKPNLNDGVQITAAPLWNFFQLRPWKNKLKETWGALEAGEYDWAHLACSIWPERVREKCKTDKSLAIAHGLEELYQEPPATAKKPRKRKAKADEE